MADDRDVLKVMIEPIGAASQTRIDYVVDVGPTLTIERSGTVVAAAGRIGTVEVTLRPTPARPRNDRADLAGLDRSHGIDAP